MYECAQSSITHNNLNLPVYDVHEQQARDQILMNLHSLAQSAGTISERHLKKCQTQRQRIQAIRGRVLKCKERIDQLEGLNQAIVFVSPCQYPTKYEFNTQNSKSQLSDFLDRTEINKLDMKAQYIVKHEISELGKEAKLKVKDLDDFVLYLFGKLKGKRATVFQKGKPNKKKIESLGIIPPNFRYLDSLSVFNTHINPYRKYEVKQNVVVLQKRDRKDQIQQMVGEDQLNNALTNYTRVAYQQDSNIYKREDKNWQQVQWDDDLEGLTGVVDLGNAFNDDTNMKPIKKKAVAQDIVPTKPQDSPQKQQQRKAEKAQRKAQEQQRKNRAAQKKQQSSSQNQTQTPTNDNQSAPMMGSLPPPPPPMMGSLPPPPMMGSLPPPPPSMLPPPPPPPMLLSAPPILASPPPLLLPPPSLPSAKPMTPGASGRSALLSQIQNPNHMKRLKRTVTKQYGGIGGATRTPPPPPPSNPVSGNGTDAPSPAPAAPMSFADEMRMKIMRRYQALHPVGDQQDEENTEI